MSRSREYFRLRGWGLSWSVALAALCVAWRSASLADPLAMHPTNPRYFDDGSGRAVYLVGSHTWDNLQDWGSPTPDFEYGQFLDLLEANDHNFFRLWSWESTGVDTGAPAEVDPMPWKRTGPGTAADGGLKFDLTQFDNAYFNRMRSRIIDARNRGMFVAIMLFQQYVDWPTHPFHADNNINGVGGNANHLHTLHDDEFVDFQEAYVQKVIDTVNDLDNVLYEIGNELVDNTIHWQHHMIDFIHDYEATKPKQHPVGMTSTGGSGTGSPLITNAELLASPADWIAPHVESGQDYAQNPPAATGARVIVSDTDHIVGVICTPNADLARAWAWRSFTRGLHLLWMEATQNVIPGVADSCQNTNNPAYGTVRRAMGDTRLYAERMDLAAMIPRGDLTSTSYALANPGIEYLVFQPGSGLLTVNLVQGSYDYEWFNPATSVVVETGTFSAGDGTRPFTPPFGGAAVLYLARNGSTSPPVANFSGSPTTGLAPLNVTFTDISTGDITNRHWTFGDGATTTTTVTNLAHSYSTAGVYTVRLVVSGIFGVSTNTKVNHITVTNPPAPAMIEIDPPAAGFPITATGTTTFANFIVINNGGSPLTGTASALGGPFSVVSGSPFNVPAGNLSIVSVGFAPMAAGTFSNQVVFASNAGNSTNVVVGTAAIPPTANFSANVRTGMPPLNVTFTDASTGSVTNRFFNFGDGATTNLSGAAVAHQYLTAGSFTVTEIASGPLGASTNTKANYIVVTNSPDPAVLGVSPDSRAFPLLSTGAVALADFVVTNRGEAVLVGSASALGGPFSVVSGSPFNVPGFGSANVTVRFAPVNAGTFTNQVVFASNGGASSNVVTGSAAATPIANFSGAPTTGQKPLVVGFTDSSTGTITNRHWDFGDGFTTNTTVANVSHSYANAGTFDVTLTVAGPLGANVKTRTNYIVVAQSSGPTPSFIATPTAGKAALTVTFVNQTIGSGLSYHWDFGDGETSTLANPLHTYSNAGTYSVSLSAMNSTGTNTFPRDNYIVVTNSIPSDATPPSLDVQAPYEWQVFTNADILVTGTASDASGLQSVTINGAAAALSGEDWSAPFALSPGTNTLTVIATDNSVHFNSVTQTVRAILGPQPGVADTNAPLVTILSPADGSAVTGRFVQVTGTAQDDGFVASVIVTNSRGGSTGATLIGEEWAAGGAVLKVGTNHLFAVATDGALNKASDSITIVRVHTNHVNTTLRVTAARLTRDGGENGDSVSVEGLFNDAGPSFDPATETAEFLFGDYEAMLPADSLLNLKYKAKPSPTNTLTSVKLSTKKRRFAFDATGFSLTTLDPFLVALALGANDLGPDAIIFPVPPGETGRFDWKSGSQPNALDQFFLGKSKLTTTSFDLTGWIVALTPPDPTIEGVCFGIGSYDDALPAGGWAQGTGNVFTFTPPIDYPGPIQSMTIDLDRGEWSVEGEEVDLSFLANDPVTEIRIEIGDFAATYRAKLIPKGEKFSY